jgi:predicted MFS family arabinose efflux permease
MDDGGKQAVGGSESALHAWFRCDVEAPLAARVGGFARLRLVLLLGGVLALDSADKAMVGAVAGQLEDSLHIGNVDVGWLVTASTGVGALLTLPFSVYADRSNRTRLLAIAIVVWSLAMGAGAASPSFLILLASRLLLGGAVAAAGPAVTSLVGDYFRPGERGRMLGDILAGELVGVAIGYMLLGNIATLASWRVSFVVLAVLGVALAYLVWKRMPEPPRGAQGPTNVGQEDAPPASASTSGTRGALRGEVRRRGIRPYDHEVLHEDPTGWPLWRAIRHVLAVRTYVALVIASALGYFYFTGVRTFAIEFMRARFSLGESVAIGVTVGVGLGAIAGVLSAGRIGDALIRRKYLKGRVVVAAAAYLLAAIAFLPGLLATSLLIAAPFFALAAGGIGGANPAVDAARLDVMHSALWGRAEGVRSTVRRAFEAAAPPLFAYIAILFGGRGGTGRFQNPGDVVGLDRALLAMLVTLAIAGLILLFRATRTYARDVATTIASEQATRDSRK